MRLTCLVWRLISTMMRRWSEGLCGASIRSCIDSGCKSHADAGTRARLTGLCKKNRRANHRQPREGDNCELALCELRCVNCGPENPRLAPSAQEMPATWRRPTGPSCRRRSSLGCWLAFFGSITTPSKTRLALGSCCEGRSHNQMFRPRVLRQG